MFAEIKKDLIRGRFNYGSRQRTNQQRSIGSSGSRAEIQERADARKVPAFDKSVDVVICRREEEYSAAITTQIKESREQGHNGPTHATLVSNILSAFLRKQGKRGRFFKAKRYVLKGNAFYSRKNLVPMDVEAVRASECLLFVLSDIWIDLGHSFLIMRKTEISFDLRKAGLWCKDQQDVIDDEDYKFLSSTDADAKYQRSIDIVLNMKDQTYRRIVEPHCKAMWEERNKQHSEGATSRAKQAFAALEEELQVSGGGFYIAHNARLVGAMFWEASNLRLVSDEIAIESKYAPKVRRRHVYY